MDLKKIISDAGASINRAVQKTQENFGAEKTELDEETKSLMLTTDAAKKWTQKLINDMEVKLQPNPAQRMEEFLYDKMDSKADRPRPSDLLGETMESAGAELENTSYGRALGNCGRAERHLGIAESRLVKETTRVFIRPLEKFLKVDIAEIDKHRGLLESRRLDLDVAKGKLRKSKEKGDAEMFEAENQLRNAQQEFDEQLAQTNALMHAAKNTSVGHLQCVKDFVECEVAYHNECLEKMKEILRMIQND